MTKLYLLPLWDSKYLKYGITTNQDSRLLTHLKNYPKILIDQGLTVSAQNDRIIQLLEKEIQQLFGIEVPEFYKWVEWATELSPIENMNNILQYIESKKKFIPELKIEQYKTTQSELQKTLLEGNYFENTLTEIKNRIETNKNNIESIEYNYKELQINLKEEVSKPEHTDYKRITNWRTQKYIKNISFWHQDKNKVHIKYRPEQGPKNEIRKEQKEILLLLYLLGINNWFKIEFNDPEIMYQILWSNIQFYEDKVASTIEQWRNSNKILEVKFEEWYLIIISKETKRQELRWTLRISWELWWEELFQHICTCQKNKEGDITYELPITILQQSTDKKIIGFYKKIITLIEPLMDWENFLKLMWFLQKKK